MKEDTFYFIVFIFLGIILIPIGSVVINKHVEVSNYELCTAIFDQNANYKPTYGSLYSNGVVKTIGYCSNSNQTFSIEIKYPPPPYSLNLKNKNQVTGWMSMISDKNMVIYLNPKTTKKHYRIGFTENVNILGWSIVIGIYGLFYLIVIIIFLIQCFQNCRSISQNSTLVYPTNSYI